MTTDLNVSVSGKSYIPIMVTIYSIDENPPRPLGSITYYPNAVQQNNLHISFPKESITTQVVPETKDFVNQVLSSTSSLKSKLECKFLVELSVILQEKDCVQGTHIVSDPYSVKDSEHLNRTLFKRMNEIIGVANSFSKSLSLIYYK